MELKNYPNLVILRTLSKAYGLAGVRCGAVLANSVVIKLFQQIIAPYPIPTPVTEIIVKQLTPEALCEVTARIQVIQEQRDILSKFLSELPWVYQVWPSHANFILLQVTDADKIMAHCRVNGIIIRDRQREYNLKNCVRITVGSPAENKILMEVLQHG